MNDIALSELLASRGFRGAGAEPALARLRQSGLTRAGKTQGEEGVGECRHQSPTGIDPILPELPPGVLLHVHDVFLPDPYPEDWAWQGYNEQLPAALLIAGGWRPVFASRYMTTRHPDRIASSVVADLPMPPGARDTTLWLCREPS